MRIALFALCVIAGGILLGRGTGGAAPAPLPEGNTGIAARYPGDQGIAKDPAVLFASGFENGFTRWSEFNPKVSTIITDPAIVHGGGACCQTTATRGQDTGGDVVVNLPKGADQVYFRFYSKLEKNACLPHHFCNIHAVKMQPRYWPNAGTRPPGDKGYWTSVEPTEQGGWLLYAYWHQMRSWNHPDGTPNNPPDGDGRSFYGNTFTPDNQKPSNMKEWVCVEAMMKANTVGQKDGEMAFWIDGKKIGQWRTGEPVGTWDHDKFVTSGPYNTKPAPFEGFDFRTDATLKINRLNLQWYVSQEVAAKAPFPVNTVYFDDVVVATSYIGPRVESK